MTIRPANLVAAALASIVLTARPAPSAAQSRPFPQHTTYAPGVLKPSNHTQAVLDQDVRTAYQNWKSRYLVQAGTEPDGHPRYRVRKGTNANDPTVSEGQGYGMVIVALMAGDDPNARTLFDGLVEFFNDHRSSIDNRLMDWYVNADESPDGNGNDSAFDGDADIAYGLLLAHAQWGSAGRINYAAQAQSSISGILASTIGPASRLPMLGDWVNPNGSPHNQYTNRSSDFMPSHFRTYGRFTNNATWTTVAENCLSATDSLQVHYSPAAGVLPDFMVPTSGSDHTPKPAPAGFLEGPNDGNYYYNAGRDPWRLGLDAVLNGNAPAAAAAAKITNWARTTTSGNAMQIKPGYLLSGSPIPPGDYFTTFFASPMGVAAMCDPADQSWLNAIYDAVRARQENYYEDSVNVICLLVMTGNYWDPNPPTTQLADTNCDSRINGNDIRPFVLALLNPAAYSAQFPTCPIINADANHDGSINSADIPAFVADLLTH